jgi:hypothetical protein
MTTPAEGDFDIYGEEEVFQPGQQQQDEVRKLVYNNLVAVHDVLCILGN